VTDFRERRWRLEPGFVPRRPGPDGSPSGPATGFLAARLGEIEIRWPTTQELELMADWFRCPEVHRALGFPLPPGIEHLRFSVLPDLTGGTEPVDLLIVHHLPESEPIGFLVVYAALGHAAFELDLAIASPEHLGEPLRIRRIELCVLGYLFAIRGADRVVWERRKRDPDEPEERAERPGLFPRQGRPVVVTRERFRRMLRARATAGGSEELPTLLLAPSKQE
jgi:hypothetical protein